MKLEKNPGESYWISPLAEKGYCVPCDRLESDDIHTLVDAILSEFTQTLPEDHREIRSLLLDWLQEMPEIHEIMIDQRKVRDFIYEMF